MKALIDTQEEVQEGDTITVSPDRVEVVSSEITAEEFIDLLGEATENYPLAPGKHAVIRSLTYNEVKRVIKENQGKRDEIELSALIIGTVFPKLNASQIALLRNKRSGPLMLMAKRIMVISGMMDDDKALGEGGAST